MRIIGIDPGSRLTGYGIIECQGRQLTYVDSGCIRVGHLPFAERLLNIFECIQTLIDEYQPKGSAIEEVFVNKNVNSALKLGQARGAAIVALASRDLPVGEYAARKIKQAVTGHGGATKEQMQEMVKSILRLSAVPQSDAADALAIAICYHHHQSHLNLIDAL